LHLSMTCAMPKSHIPQFCFFFSTFLKQIIQRGKGIDSLPRFWIQNRMVDSVFCLHMPFESYKSHLTKTWLDRLIKTPFSL
jgi:hypothetical protein